MMLCKEIRGKGDQRDAVYEVAASAQHNEHRDGNAEGKRHDTCTRNKAEHREQRRAEGRVERGRERKPVGRRRQTASKGARARRRACPM